MNLLKITIFLLIFNLTYSQNNSRETVPQFENCKDKSFEETENCFYATIQNTIFKEFKMPNEVASSSYKGTIYALFEVDTLGNFKINYIDTPFESLRTETQRIFENLPKVTPSKYANRAIVSKFTLKIEIPLVQPETTVQKNNSTITANSGTKKLTELEAIPYYTFENPQFKNNGNIIFTHQNYTLFDGNLNQIGSNNHTASKPYSYAEVAKYYDFEAEQKKLNFKTNSWLSRKLWNENLAQIQGDGYWFTLNPVIDLRMGKDTESSNSTFVNTRGIKVEGALGEQLTFTTSLFESQGRFANYYNKYAESIKPTGGNPATIPGIGIAKKFKEDAYDFPLAEASLKYTPSKFINLQLGYGRNFIGDGYRSLFHSDGTSPYPFLKINTTFWKIKYTNTYMWLKDSQAEATTDGTYGSKYMASHYLSWNVSNRLNLGFFESVIWTNTNNRAFDFNFVNPLIFYRTVEFGSSSKTGNAVLGLAAKYKITNQINAYSQFLIDEFSVGDVKANNKSWKNKFGYQFGIKYNKAFNINNLYLQVEYNQVRPYVYSHSKAITNYGHHNQNMGHNWGANFHEFIGIARYTKNRYFAEMKLIYGKKGFDFNTTSDTFNYGGNIYLDYDENRPFDTNAITAQGNKTTIMIADFQAGYLVNPATNLKLFGTVLLRNFDPATITATTQKSNTTWFSLGIRSDVFNWYFDY